MTLLKSTTKDEEHSLFQTNTKSFDFIESSSIKQMDHNMARLSDYMVRAQQLVTLLVGQDRMTSQVRTAMKKMDWERVQTQVPSY